MKRRHTKVDCWTTAVPVVAICQCIAPSSLLSPSLHSPPPADVAVQFTLPPTYPDVPPEVTVTAASGLGEEEQRELERVIGEQVRE